MPVALAWSLVAGAAGGTFGLVGALWWYGAPETRALSIALPAGLAGEAVLLMGEWSGRAARLVLGAELFAGLLAMMLSRRRAPVQLTLALFLVSAVVIAGVEDVARDGVRLVGWRGP